MLAGSLYSTQALMIASLLVVYIIGTGGLCSTEGVLTRDTTGADKLTPLDNQFQPIQEPHIPR